MVCEFCDYEFDGACGRYGCPNCLGEGLEMSTSDFGGSPIIKPLMEEKCQGCEEKGKVIQIEGKVLLCTKCLELAWHCARALPGFRQKRKAEGKKT